jgi:hypothetical protein
MKDVVNQCDSCSSKTIAFSAFEIVMDINILSCTPLFVVSGFASLNEQEGWESAW